MKSADRQSRTVAEMVRPQPLVVVLVVYLLGAGILVDSATAYAGAPTPRPNVVLILADDLGFGDVGFNGAELIKTPNIDRIAEEGVRLNRFFSSANVCTPSRAGLLTGRYPVRSGLARTVLFPFSDYGIDARERLLPEVLRDAGYATWLVGKWHLGAVPGAWPTQHGFDHFFGLLFSNDMPGVALYEGNENVQSPIDQAALHGQLADQAVRLIDQAGDQPFFLYFAPVAPHLPIVPSPDFAGRSAAGPYGDVVQELDDGVGRILAALEEKGIADNTIVMFTSDNGRAFEGSSGGARGMKANTGEGGYAVPFAARWPGELEPGVLSDAIAMNTDLMPTILELAGIAEPPDVELDGKSLATVLGGDQESPHEALFFFDRDQVAAVRTQRWRYVVRTYYAQYPVDHLSEQFTYPLLFDIERHGHELYNVGPRYPDAAAAMHEHLLRAREALEGLPQKETPWPEPE